MSEQAGAQPDTLPFLPGNTFLNVLKSDFRKSHLLDTKNGYQVPRELSIGHIPQTLDELDNLISDANACKLTYNKKLNLCDGPKFVPSFVIFDKVVLRFKAYFKQTLQDSTEQYLLRVVVILYYLEDDSIAVIEPPKPNSGLQQGVLIKRQRLPKSSTEFFTVLDFNLGINLTFYAKTYRIIDCDAFTKSYIETNTPIKLSPSEEVPVDKYIQSRIRHTPTRPIKAPHDDKLWKFLKHDRHVLRFFCKWDDEIEVRNFVMHYFLVDDCIEVKEVHCANDGREVCPLMLKRQKLPKVFSEMDDLKFADAYYTWQDFNIGSTVNVLNRQFFIHDCDDYTRLWFKQNLGLDMVSIPVEKPKPPKPQRQFPPHTGFGSEEDSLQSCLHLVLQPPKSKWSQALKTDVLRYIAVMESRHSEDSTRKFIISVYVPGCEVSIYEPPQRNSGTLGGKFLEKGKVNAPVSTHLNPIYYTPKDFYVGATLKINTHTFKLVDCDEHVFKYMEQYPNTYPMACVRTVLGKLSADGSIADLKVCLNNATLNESLPAFSSSLLPKLKSLVLNAHEISTLFRNQKLVQNLLL